MFETTSISCIASRSGTVKGDQGSGASIEYLVGHSPLWIKSTKNLDELLLRMDGTASDIVFHRIQELPDVCNHEAPNTPQENYRIFWQTFAEQYPFFGLHKIDWGAADREFRSKVTSNTSPIELFQIFRNMIEPLRDMHTGLEAESLNAEFENSRNDAGQLDEQHWSAAQALIESKYVRAPLTPFCKGRVQFGILGKEIGYLRITTFYDYTEQSGFSAQHKCLQDSLDTIFAKKKALSGLIIDVRLNKGGDDPLGIEIASRFTEKTYLAYNKAARRNTSLDEPLELTAKQSTWVVPSSGARFTGQVVLLTGPDTVSAGETFTMALMGREPHVVRVGLNTQGVFSDVLNRHLPNGWRFGLPNEVYFDAEGHSFDGAGIPPEDRVPFFSQKDVREGRDAALEAAIRMIKD